MMSNEGSPLLELTWRQRLQHLWVRFWWMDLVLGLLVIAVWHIATNYCWFSAERCVLPQALTEVPAESRRTLYQIIAAAAATMGGFTLTSVSILVNLLRTPLSTVDRLLPAQDKTRVGSAFLRALPWLFALFVIALLCLTTDVNAPHGYWWMQLAVTGLVVSATLSLGRVVWVLRRLLTVSAE
jgi:hypothetical protein